MKCAILLLCCTVLLAGCVPPDPVQLKPKLESGPLGFLQDGKTTRDEIFLKLGEPSAKFEGERILTYRLNYSPDIGLSIGGLPYVAPGYAAPDSAGYSLVLIFNAAGILEKHNAVPLKQGTLPEP
jgi:hypothetical protein